MATNKDYSVGYKFTGDAAGFQKAVGSMQTSVDRLTGTKTKVMNWATTFLTVGAAIEGFKKIMGSTEGSADALDKVMGTLHGTLQGVMRTIASGDWGAFFQNIKNTAAATRDLKVAMDSLQDISASNRLKKSRLSNELETTKVAIAGTSNAGEKQILIQRALDIQKTITGIELDEQNKRIENKYEYYRKLIDREDSYWNYLKKQIPVIAENWQYFNSEATKAGLQASKSSLEYRNSLGILSEAQKNEHTDITHLIWALEDYNTLKNDKSGPGEFNAFIDELSVMGELAAKGEQDLKRLTSQLTAVEGKLQDIERVKSPSKAFIGGGFAERFAVKVKGGGMARGGKDLAEGPLDFEAITSEAGIAEQAVQSLEESFATMVTNTEEGFNALIGSFERLVGQIVAKAAIVGLLNLIAPGSNMAVKALTGFKSFVGVPGYASGTSFAPGGLSLVGENGPELVNLPRGSSVTPLKDGKISLYSRISNRSIIMTGTVYNNRLYNNT